MIKEKTNIENIDGKSFKIKLIEIKGSKNESLKHYFNNQTNETSHLHKKDALAFVKGVLEKEYPRDEITNTVAEEALQYLIFDFNKSIPFPAPKKPKFKFIDLFAGIGGFRMALQNLDGKCVFTSEWDKYSKKTYLANFGEIPFGDITKRETKNYIPDEFDVLCAGFPCQAFSIAGRRGGFEDTRGTLFFDVAEIIKKHRPKAIFLENVKGLRNHDKGKTFKTIIDVLSENLGYKVYHSVLNSMTHTDIPQNRERIFIVAFDPKQVVNFEKFKFPEKRKLKKTIHDILEKGKQEDRYYYPKDHQYYPELEKTITSKDTIYQWRRVYVRENKNNVCPTLTANMGTGGHNVPLIKDNYGIRKLTPRECLSFQGYPRNYILPNLANGRLYMQVGNSVTATLIERIANEIIKIL